MLKLISTHDPCSFISSFRVSFNENEILLCSKEIPSEQHLRVVVPDSSVEGNFGGVGLRVDKSDGESESGGEGGGCGEGQGELKTEDRGGSRSRSGGEGEGGGGDGRGGRGNMEDGGGGGGGDVDKNWRSTISKLAKMSIMVTVQSTAASIGFRSCGQHSPNRIFLIAILVTNLVGYLCCIISILLIHKKPQISETLGGIGSIVVSFGFILLTSMFFVESLVC